MAPGIFLYTNLVPIVILILTNFKNAKVCLFVPFSSQNGTMDRCVFLHIDSWRTASNIYYFYPGKIIYSLGKNVILQILNRNTRQPLQMYPSEAVDDKLSILYFLEALQLSYFE